MPVIQRFYSKYIPQEIETFQWGKVGILAVLKLNSKVFGVLLAQITFNPIDNLVSVKWDIFQNVSQHAGIKFNWHGAGIGVFEIKIYIRMSLY